MSYIHRYPGDPFLIHRQEWKEWRRLNFFRWCRPTKLLEHSYHARFLGSPIKIKENRLIASHRYILINILTPITTFDSSLIVRSNFSYLLNKILSTCSYLCIPFSSPTKFSDRDFIVAKKLFIENSTAFSYFNSYRILDCIFDISVFQRSLLTTSSLH